MLVMLWFYAITAAAFPGGQSIVSRYAETYENYVRSHVPTTTPARPSIAVGAAQGFAR